MWRRGVFGDDPDLCASFLSMIFLHFPGTQSCCFVKLTQLESGERTQAGKREDSRTEKKPAERRASSAGLGSIPWGGPLARQSPTPSHARSSQPSVRSGLASRRPLSPSARHWGGHLCQSFEPHRATCEVKNKKFRK